MFLPISTDTPTQRTPWVTFSLIGTNTLVYLLSLGFPEDGRVYFFYFFGLVPGFVTGDFGLWHKTVPFITCQFLHGGSLHLVGNCLFLFVFGNEVEARMGPRRYLLFYLLCGVGSCLFYLMCSRDPFIALIGASGAISGVMGAFLVLYPLTRIRLFFMIKILFFIRQVTVPAFVYLGFFFILQIALGILDSSSDTAYWGHVGGFIAGALLCTLVLPKTVHRRDAAERTSPVRIRDPKRKIVHNKGRLPDAIQTLVYGRVMGIPGYIYIVWALLQTLFFVWWGISADVYPTHAALFLALIVLVICLLVISDYQADSRSRKTSFLIISRKSDRA